MTLNFKKAPPAGAPKKTQLEGAIAIHKEICHGKHLFAIKQLPDGYEFDYRIQITEYNERHIFALIHGKDVKLGQLTTDTNGYFPFERSTIYAEDYNDDTAELASFAANQFDSLWKSVDVMCRTPIRFAFYIYE